MRVASATFSARPTARKATPSCSNLCATSGWSSSSTSATARSSARTTRPSRHSSRRHSYSASPVRRSLKRTPPSGRSRVTSPRYAPPRTSSSARCTSTRSPTPSRTGMSCASTSTTTSFPTARPSSLARRSQSAPSSTRSSRSTTPPPATADSTRSSPPRRSTRPSSTTSCSRRLQAERQAADPEFVPLNVAAVFSPPGDVSADVRQIQEDLPQERDDNQQDPEEKKKALTAIIADYNGRFGTNHSHRRVRSLLPGRAEAHQGPAVPQCRSAEEGPRED